MTQPATDIELAEAYFTPCVPEFWRWSEPGCREIEGTWPAPTLIIFREELTQILAELQPHGWPAFSEVLLLCAALRDNWSEHRGWLNLRLSDANHRRPTFVSQMLEGLDRVHQLPKRLREPTTAKIQIARMVFERTRPRLIPDEAEVVLRYLQSIIPFRDPISWTPLGNDAESLRFFDASVSKAALESRLQTGLEQEVLPADIAPPEDAATYGARLAQWKTDAELFGVAKIARQLISIVSWPRSVSEPDDISLGGVSDVTNTGPLDRLLLSELAHDDDTLAVRIALKEALYLRRESPAHPMPRRRAVLVDTSLRLWGRPRVYAAGVALALAAAQDAEAKLNVTVDVTDLDGWQPVDLSTRAGAEEMLSCLAPALHSAACLAEWSEQRIPDDMPCDPVLITTAETLVDPEMQLALGNLPAEFHAAVVAADGRFELRRHTVHGWRTVRTATLDLDDLLQPPVNTRPLPLTRHGDERFPAILKTEPFPLRLTHALEAGHFWMLPGHRMISQASGNRLMLWDGPQKAARQIATNAPANKVEASFTPHQSDPTTYAVIRAAAWMLLRINLVTGELKTLTLPTSFPANDQTVKGVIVPECAFLIARTSIQAFSLENGELLSERRTNRYHTMECVGHRFLRDDEGNWLRLGFDGMIQLTPLKEHSRSLMVVDQSCLETPQDEPLCLPCSRSKQVGRFTVPQFQQNQIERVRQQESLVMLHGTFTLINGYSYSHSVTAIWDLDAPEWKWNVVYAPLFDIAARYHALSKFRPRQNLRYKFATLDCSGNRICLKSSRQWWQLVLRNDHLRLIAIPTIPQNEGQTSFEKKHWPGISFPIRTAMLPNGNTIWLDGRGMMHLLPARTDQPEVTLVLDEDNVSGWISSGLCFGDEYYREEGVPIHLHRAWSDYVAPFFGVAP